jgi:outer membrane lipoprotein SlyB
VCFQIGSHFLLELRHTSELARTSALHTDKHMTMSTSSVLSFSTALRGVTAAFLIAALAACATSSPDVVQRSAAQRMSQVQDATVLSVRTITIDGSQTGGGAAAGALAGGVAGSTVGGKREAAVVGVLGAVAGAVVGNAVERASTKEEGLEILIQLKNGERRSLVQGIGKETFEPGDAVVLVTTDGKTRLIKAPK